MDLFDMTTKQQEFPRLAIPKDQIPKLKLPRPDYSKTERYYETFYNQPLSNQKDENLD